MIDRAAMIGALLFAFAPALAQETRVAGAEVRRDLSITIYNEDLAMIRDVRRLDIVRGESRLELADVSAQIRPETAILEADGLSVVEQNFDFDLLTPRALIEKAVGQQVQIYRSHPTTGEDRMETARVLAATDGVVLEIDGRIEILSQIPGRIVFPDLPPKLRARPTLSTLVESERNGARDISLSYLTGGLSWAADYVGVLSTDETRLDLKGWITLTNRSGTDFVDAATQLVAGDVHRVREDFAQPRARGGEIIVSASRVVAEEALLDYHLYTLPHRTTVADKQTKQVSFLEAPEVAVEKVYRFQANGFQSWQKPQAVPVLLGLSNRREAGLGEPLPAGIVRIYAADSADRPQFVGEDRIDHTPEGNALELALGRAFDVTVLATMEDRTLIRASRDGDIYEVTQAYELRNAKEAPVTVELRQSVYGEDWEVLSESVPHEAADAASVTWRLTVPAKGGATLRFSMRVEE